MKVMGLYIAYFVIMQKWGCWGIFLCPIMLICLSSCAEWIGMVGLCFGSLVKCLCAWISAKTCNSRSGELGSPRRDMQGRVPSICSWLSLRWRILGFGQGFISLRRV